MHPNAIIHEDLEQGSPEWLAARRGLMTASEMNLVLTPTLKPSNNDKTRAHIYEIAAQRITEWTEPTYIGDAMLRGHADEITARDLYSDRIEPVEEKGFITRDFGGFMLGYSPDGCGIMGNFGIECKSRVQKHHIKTVITNEVPTEYMLQVQTGLLVTGWDYMDYISFSAGLPMWIIRVEPIAEYQDAIINAAESFEESVRDCVKSYSGQIKGCKTLIETEREPDEDYGEVL
jgi:predicted phage-related endonuclease